MITLTYQLFYRVCIENSLVNDKHLTKAPSVVILNLVYVQRAKLLSKPWLNTSANECTKASSESCCVDRLYVIKSDWFNFPFIPTRYAIGDQTDDVNV